MSSRSKSRRWWFPLLVGVATYLLAEILAWFVVPIAVAPFEEIARARRQRQAVEPASAGASDSAPPETLVPHPFVGFVHEPGSRYFHYDANINGQGFAGPEWVPGDPQDEVVVAIAGGSFAMRFFLDSHDVLERLLRERFRRPVRVVCLAVSAHRQPQQLFAVQYFLALGGTIDALVNIDGFNEAVNNENENPAYPWAWALRIGPGREEMVLMGAIARARQLASRAARIVESMPSTPLVNLAWMANDHRLQRRILALNQEVAAANRDYSFRRDGPRVEAEDQQRYAARLWARSSILLGRLSEAHRISYLHVLQPNQYLPESKPFSDEERRLFLGWENEPLPAGHAAGNHLRTYADEVRHGYRLIREEAGRLARSGVAFRDLTGIYSGREETLYMDSCCHVNKAGNDIFADELAALVDLRPGSAILAREEGRSAERAGERAP